MILGVFAFPSTRFGTRLVQVDFSIVIKEIRVPENDVLLFIFRDSSTMAELSMSSLIRSCTSIPLPPSMTPAGD